MAAIAISKAEESSKKRVSEKESPLSIQNNYTVTLDIFEGPLDLLIHLIKKEKIDICNVSIAKITDQYLAFIETMRVLDLDIAGEFLVMSATLIYIKSRNLLETKNQLEEEELEEQKKDLVERLMEYQKYKEVTEHLAHFAEERSKLFSRQAYPPDHINQKMPDIKLGIFDLVQAIQGVLNKVQKKDILISIEITEIDIQDKIRQTLVFLGRCPNTYFDAILEGNYERQNIVVTFLALLELIKAGKIRIQQSVPFGEVKVQVSVLS